MKIAKKRKTGKIIINDLGINVLFTWNKTNTAKKIENIKKNFK